MQSDYRICGGSRELVRPIMGLVCFVGGGIIVALYLL